MPSERRCSLFVSVQANPGPPFGFLAPLFRSSRIHADHGPPERGAELAERLVPCRGEYLVLDCAGTLVIQHAGALGDEPRTGEIDAAAGKRYQGVGQPPSQGDREI